ncbi:CGGC domain-containing protein [Selenihalanaerobacter shriftii]|uniref:Predicted metal-binding protein n=1 Tax=Selenihalanaerobacter shriftii TaxID=142842 RepID=A0A1T4NYD6_9FIRM|nr:CGGC domain-containing protein [Selenihalanaerobacter shriftii]SJZ84231.1 Predicted metal-binding protein [Selenihalanaerobacter shriftii]
MTIKAGLIRCQQTEDYCPATTCFTNAREGKGGLEETGPVEIIALNTCGGCSGKKAISRAMTMKERGAEIIIFASCILRGTPGYIDYKCPFGKKLKKLVEEKTSLEVIEWTH